jgi:hypothetical protein
MNGLQTSTVSATKQAEIITQTRGDIVCQNRICFSDQWKCIQDIISEEGHKINEKVLYFIIQSN